MYNITLEVIESLLQQRHINGAKMCDDLGFSRSTMTELRKGRNKALSTDKLVQIADYFNVTVDYLLGRNEKTAANNGDGLSPERKQFAESVMRLDDSQFQMVYDIVRRVLAEQERGL